MTALTRTYDHSADHRGLPFLLFADFLAACCARHAKRLSRRFASLGSGYVDKGARRKANSAALRDACHLPAHEQAALSELTLDQANFLLQCLIPVSRYSLAILVVIQGNLAASRCSGGHLIRGSSNADRNLWSIYRIYRLRRGLHVDFAKSLAWAKRQD